MQKKYRFGSTRLVLLVKVMAAMGVLFAAAAMAAPPHVIQTPAEARLVGMESLRLAVQQDGGVPLPPDLDNYVRDKKAAVQLGKALFWDMQLGSDGVQSCATCHFHAGADARVKNQIGLAGLRVKDQVDGKVKGLFNAEPASRDRFELPGANHLLTRWDFPLVRFPDQWREEADGSVSPAPGNSNDVLSSAGVFFTLFTGIQNVSRRDNGTAQFDTVFNVGGVTTRRVEPRQAPSVINAVFNFHSFWDGRANNIFNGNNPFGNQDPDARIYVVEGSELVQKKVELRNASLASQSVGPPQSFFEMSFGDGVGNSRTWPEIGRKLLSLQPLARQRVSENDSVLGPLAKGARRGLNQKRFVDALGSPMNGYRYLIQKAFRPEYWSSDLSVTLPGPGGAPGATFSQIEANMAFLFGVSVMLYEATLVSDDAPFDRWMAGSGSPVPGFGVAELRGLNVFVNEGKCINCHGGPEFTNASVRNAQRGKNMIEPMPLSIGEALYDNGYYNIGVTLTTDDLGRGGKDLHGRPLAHSRQVLFERLGIMDIPFDITGDPFPVTDENNLVTAGKDTNGSGFIEPGEEILIQRVAVDGAFKTPGLRNVELTGPYMHNGGFATLRQVVAFYNRGGDFPGFNEHDMDTDITMLELTENQQRDLVSFMVSLTDPRVRKQSAPFDHPELFVPQGVRGDSVLIRRSDLTDGVAQGRDSLRYIPPTGRNGGITLRPFLGLDPQLRLLEPAPSPFAKPFVPHVDEALPPVVVPTQALP